MEAAIIAIGSELLGTSRLDTNSLLLTRCLEKYGVAVVKKSVVGDHVESIAVELEHTLPSCDLVLMTGGVGPTEDDVTKEAVARALGLVLVLDQGVLDHIAALFERRGLRMPEVNRKQAEIFAGQRVIMNLRGTAPGFHLEVALAAKRRHVWIFPGVPFELEGMIEGHLEAWLKEVTEQSIYRRTVKITGMTESAVDERLAPFYALHSGDPITILAHRGEIHLHLRARGIADDAYTRLTAMETELRDIFAERIFGLDEDLLEAVVGRLLASAGETVATAESCTGGLLASRITDVSGSSAYFLGGVVAYSREAKRALLDVDHDATEAHGEVSDEVALQMANGARQRFSSTYGIGITGIAGPTGGTATKPVGTVHIAVGAAEVSEQKRFLLAGSRELVKHYATQLALDMLRRVIVRGRRGEARG
ncbi:MAG TPA: competence/damage-inducible protein A [Thermoanaerobaculia bacterium]|nr:competence/damage-inducible protein A [Thermoanaerobaculia bacterium]